MYPCRIRACEGSSASSFTKAYVRICDFVSQVSRLVSKASEKYRTTLPIRTEPVGRGDFLHSDDCFIPSIPSTKARVCGWRWKRDHMARDSRKGVEVAFSGNLSSDQ